MFYQNILVYVNKYYNIEVEPDSGIIIISLKKIQEIC